MTRRQPKYAKKRDTAEKGVVGALKAAGCGVYKDLPCDLLIRRPRDPPGMMWTMENKTPTATGKLKLDKRQEAQAKFCAETGTPYVTEPEAALRFLGLTDSGDGA